MKYSQKKNQKEPQHMFQQKASQRSQNLHLGIENEDQQDMDFFTKRENYFVYEDFTVFGDFNIFNIDKFYQAKKNWVPCYVYAIDESIVYKVNYIEVEKHMIKLIEQQKQAERIMFLMSNIPDIHQQITSNREKILSSFVKKTFIPGQVLLKEDEAPQEAFIILEGECEMQSNKIPLHMSIMNEDPKRGKYFVANSNGLFSKTMNTFQLGLVNKNSWIGDEILEIYQNIKLNRAFKSTHKEETNITRTFNQTGETQQTYSPNQTYNQSYYIKKPQETSQTNILIPGTYLPYSIKARTNIVAYSVSKEDLLQKFPKEIQRKIIDQAKHKQEWIEKRFKDIQLNIMKIFKKEYQVLELYEKSKEIQRKYPSATKLALKSIDQLSTRLKGNRNTSLEAINEEQENKFSQGFLKQSFDQRRLGRNFSMADLANQSINEQSSRNYQGISILPQILNQSTIKSVRKPSQKQSPQQHFLRNNMYRNESNYDEVLQDDENSSHLDQSFEKIMLKSASTYKYTKDQQDVFTNSDQDN